MSPGEIWIAVDQKQGVLMTQEPEAFTKNWTSSFQRFVSPFILVEQVLDFNGDPACWMVLTCKGVMYTWINVSSSATRLDA